MHFVNVNLPRVHSLKITHAVIRTVKRLIGVCARWLASIHARTSVHARSIMHLVFSSQRGQRAALFWLLIQPAHREWPPSARPLEP